MRFDVRSPGRRATSVSLAINQKLFAPLLELLDTGGPAFPNFSHALSRFDGVDRRLVSKQPIELLEVELLRVEPVENFGDGDADIHNVAVLTVDQQNRDAAASLPFEGAVGGGESNWNKAHAFQAGFVQLRCEFDIMDVRRAYHFKGRASSATD